MPIPDLIRPDLAALEPYTPIVPLDVLAARLGMPIDQIIKLDANENPYGPSPRALAALAHEPHYAIYPDPDQGLLRQALAAYTGQPAERIVCGAGADELIDLLARLCLAPGDVVIDCPPTFGMYRFSAQVCGGRVMDVPRRPDFTLDIAGICQAAEHHQAKIVFVAAPNNPTGTPLAHADLLRLLELPALIIVDEAYVEFSGGSFAGLVGVYENLVVLRTFSKWAGLAGLRLGYGMMDAHLAAYLMRIKPPYNVNQAAQAAALASLDDLEYLQANVARIVAERERLSQALHTLPALEPFESVANFILCRVNGCDAAALKDALARRGILVRYYRTALLRDYIRISVGTPAQHDRLLAALAELVATT